MACQNDNFAAKNFEVILSKTACVEPKDLKPKISYSDYRVILFPQ